MRGQQPKEPLSSVFSRYFGQSLAFRRGLTLMMLPPCGPLKADWLRLYHTPNSGLESALPGFLAIFFTSC